MTTTTATIAVRNAIATALAAVPGVDWPTGATAVLAAMGYRSELVLEDQTGDPADFIRQFDADNPGTHTEQRFLEDARSVQLVFQITNAEIAEAAAPSQPMMFDAGGFDTGNAQSFLFLAVDLAGDNYSRGRYAEFTREINKRLAAPAVVLFRTASNRVTFAFPHRRPNRRDPGRDVQGRVSLIREIVVADPHRAHLDILAELSLSERLRWMEAHGKQHNFDGLLDAWLDALDTEELNRRFYNDLFQWFERAVKTAKFPADEAGTLSPEEHVIRLITRLMFVWFIKEKGLVAGELFTENQVTGLLKDYDRDTGDSYYRAVLQNLFFATLNTEIGDRRFSRKTRDDHRNFSVYRYEDEIARPDELLRLFETTPFINGGLFDCLDSFDAAGRGGVRVDCFTDNPAHRAGYSIPNRLLFDESRDTPGLINLLDRYKFTVEENTPAEQEVALDPELLGKVFENLLAAYNPETRENARKQTGSYYTPRAVVDYMVDAALVAAIAQKVADSGAAPSGHPELVEGLRRLLDYGDPDAGEQFAPAEREVVVRAIAQLKALDPAVGSGAFPMGILHKLTLVLRRLDPGNQLWERVQRDEAADRSANAYRNVGDDQQRSEALAEIENTFRRYRDSDFGRKLYLIQNSIYGVDIQPVATQIAKLRFFISLAIEQQPNTDPADNYGIRPLPNLETRFVAADTLRGLEKKNLQIPLGGQNRVTELYDQLQANGERHFHAGVRGDKLRIRQEDKQLKEALAVELEKAGISKSDAGKIASWDRYDQNAPATDWFDAKTMFNVADEFDIVIANPPYVQLQKDGGRLGRLYKDAGYATYARTGDVYQLFYEKGCGLLAPNTGILAYITSNSWLKAEYGKSTRRYFAERHTPLQLLEMGKDVFENVIVDAGILIARSGKSAAPAKAVDMDKLADKTFPPADDLWGELRPDGENPWTALSSSGHAILEKMQEKGTPLKDWDVNINRGVTTGYNDAFIIDDATRQRLIDADPNSTEIMKPVLRGRDIQSYQVNWPGSWLIYVPWHFPLHLDSTIQGVSEEAEELFEEQYPAVYEHLLSHKAALSARNKSETGIRYEWYALQRWAANYHNDFAKEKLIWMDLTEQGRFAYSNSEMFCANSAFVMTGPALKYLCAVLNSNLVTWYMGNTALNSGMGVTRWIPVTVERIPIPKISVAKQRPLVRLVERILEANAADPEADTTADQEQIDGLVYALYGLTEDEETAVERALGLIHQTDEEEDEALLRAMEDDDFNDRVSLDEVLETLREPDAS